MASWNEFVTLDGPTPTIGPKAIILNDAIAYFEKFSTDSMGVIPIAGHFLDGDLRSQLERGVSAFGLGGDNRKVDVSKQKHVSTMMYRAIAANSQTYVDRSLLGIRAGLAYRVSGLTLPNEAGTPTLFTGPDDSFTAHKFQVSDGQHKFHNKWMFCEHSARALRICKASSFYTGATATEVDALATMLGDVADWAINSTVDPDDDYDKFYRNTKNVNQLLRVAVGLHQVGLLTGTTAYVTEGQTRMEQIFSADVQQGQTSRHISPGGIFKEKRVEDGDGVEAGFDVVYQTVSLDNLCTYYMTLSAGTWKTTVYNFIVLGVRQWLHVLNSRVSAVGRDRKYRRILGRGRPFGYTPFVDDKDSTRTAITGAAPGIAPVDWDRDVMAWRMHMWHYLGVSTTLGVRIDFLADRMMYDGLSFGHRPDDSGDDDDPT